MRIFMSHASQDKAFVQAAQARLPAHVRVWLDVDQLYAGHRLSDELRHAVLDENDYVIVFVSEHTLQSAWVGREVVWALEREADLGRPFVVPVMLPGVPLDAAPAGDFAPLWQRIYLQGGDGPAAVGDALGRHLFGLVSAWIETAGDSSRRRFIARLRADLTGFADAAHLMLGVMRNPIPVLAQDADALAALQQHVGDYGRCSDPLIARLPLVRTRARDLFGSNLASEVDRLLTMLEEKVYRGRLFDLNAVLESVNGYETSLQGHATRLKAAEAQREQRLDAAHTVLQQFTRKTLSVMDKLERE